MNYYCLGEKDLYEKTTKTKQQKQITKWTSASSQDGVIRNRFTFLPETTIKADKIHGTRFFGY